VLNSNSNAFSHLHFQVNMGYINDLMALFTPTVPAVLMAFMPWAVQCSWF